MEINNNCDKNNIDALSRLIRDGNQQFQQYNKEGARAIFVLGKPGAGKSTLIHALASRKLLSVLDEDTGELIINTVEPLEDIVINHKASSESKIPRKCHIRSTLIWEYPGFDENDPVQEAANYFYTRKLFEITKGLRFVLVVPERDLTAKRGSEFLETLSNFIKMFKDIEFKSGSTALVVTKVAKRKGKEHIRKTVENVLACNQRVTDKHKKLIPEILSSLYLFHEPNETDIIKFPEILKCIDSSAWSVVNENMVSCGISEASKALVNDLLNATSSDFNKLVEIIAKAILDPTSLNVSAFNIFSENHSQIKDWISASVLYKNNQETRYYFFPELELLTKLQKVLQNHQVSDVSDMIKIWQQCLEIFLQYVEPNTELSRQIQDYGFCLVQQYEFMTLLLSTFEVVEQIDCTVICENFELCREKIKENLELAFSNLDISVNKSDENYYRRAIQLLRKYQYLPNCVKQLALAYECLGLINQSKDESVALKYFLKSISIDEEQLQIYSKLGILLTNAGQYAMAISIYKTFNSKLQKMIEK